MILRSGRHAWTAGRGLNELLKAWKSAACKSAALMSKRQRIPLTDLLRNMDNPVPG
jgi:hypothetical protein